MKTTITIFFLIGFASCSTTSTHRDIQKLGAPLGEFVSATDHAVKIRLGSEKITGKATGGLLFSAIPYGASDYVDSTSFSSQYGFQLAGDRLSQIKSAAMRNAVDKADCDIIAYPVFRWNRKENLVSTSYSVSVTGFPGHIESVTNIERTLVPAQYQFGAKCDHCTSVLLHHDCNSAPAIDTSVPVRGTEQFGWVE